MYESWSKWSNPEGAEKAAAATLCNNKSSHALQVPAVIVGYVEFET